MVTWDNYEEYMIMHADGELNDSEEQALQAFISEHKELLAEMKLYEQIKLTPDATEVFANKELLLKQEGGRRLISLKNIRSYGIAAGIAALLCLATIKWILPGTSKQPITASVPTKQKNATKAVPPNTIAQVTPISTQQTQTEKPSMTNNRPATIRKTPKPQIAVAHEPINQMSIIALKTIKSEAPKTETAQAIAMQQAPMPQNINETSIADESDPKNKKDILDILNPTDEERSKFETIKNAVVSSVEQVRQLKKNIKQSDISLKFGGREVAVINF